MDLVLFSESAICDWLGGKESEHRLQRVGTSNTGAIADTHGHPPFHGPFTATTVVAQQVFAFRSERSGCMLGELPEYCEILMVVGPITRTFGLDGADWRYTITKQRVLRHENGNPVSQDYV